jgi:Tol biopolymer transport system component
MRGLAALCLVAACGRIGFEPLEPGPFGNAHPLVELNTTVEDDDPTLSADGLELIFASARPGGLGDQDLWVTTRASLDATWDPPVLLPNVNSTMIDKGPGLARDGLTLFFVSTRGAAKEEIYFTMRPDKQTDWGLPQRIAPLALAMSVGTPSVDGTHMVLRVSLGSDNDDLYTSDFLFGVWTPPQPIAELETPDNDSAPELMNGVTLYFDSNRPGGLGGGDIYIADLDVASGTFGPPRALDGIASTDTETDPALTADETVIVFVRQTPAGDNDLWEASR